MVMDKMRQVFKVSVQGIELGMFVSRLDRPWLETSFPLEGFEIKTEEELQKLQRICSHVYVDIASGRSLWLVKVYEVVYDPGIEDDKREVYIRSLRLDAARGRLLVDNERGERFAVVLDGSQVQKLSR